MLWPADVDASPPRFRRRTAVLFAAGGICAYLVSLPVFFTRSVPVVFAVSVVRLLLGAALAAWLAGKSGWRRAAPLYPLAVAVPYPVNLALLVYLKRFEWLPFDMARALSGPTASLIWVTAILLASLAISAAAIRKTSNGDDDSRLRQVQTLLFTLTTISVVLVPSSLSLWSLHYVVEPVALAAYCAVIGLSSGSHTAPTGTPRKPD
ncbi:MAG: hypothetical protein C5B51_20450 [Terriglobia bacterium]|nr:MAG: hypothetical protein C5B51_20450 [Terriglobia bacterium]